MTLKPGQMFTVLLGLLEVIQVEFNLPCAQMVSTHLNIIKLYIQCGQ